MAAPAASLCQALRAGNGCKSWENLNGWLAVDLSSGSRRGGVAVAIVASMCTKRVLNAKRHIVSSSLAEPKTASDLRFHKVPPVGPGPVLRRFVQLESRVDLS